MRRTKAKRAECARRNFIRRLVLCTLGLPIVACSNRTSPSAPQEMSTMATAAAATTSVPAEIPRTVPIRDWLGFGDGCSAGHDGLLIDLGGNQQPLSRARGTASSPAEMKHVEQEGASWSRITGRELIVPFRLTNREDLGKPQVSESPEPSTNWNRPVPSAAPSSLPRTPKRPPSELGEYLVEVRARGGAAKGFSAVLNGKNVGAAGLGHNEIRTLRIRSRLAPEPGKNEIALRFFGQMKAADTAADIDWIRIGAWRTESSSPPTWSNLLSTVDVAKEKKRAVLLRAQSFFGCVVPLEQAVQLRASVAVTGADDAIIDIASYRDGAARTVLYTSTLANGKPWTNVDLRLDSSEQATEVRFETRAELPKNARILIGEPAVFPVEGNAPGKGTEQVADKTVAKEQAQGGGNSGAGGSAVRPLKFRNVVLVVLGSIDLKRTSVAGGDLEMPILGSIASNALIFDEARATSSTASGNLASMLSGVPGRTTGMRSPLLRVPKDLSWIPSIIRQAKLQTAMFTGNPLTFRPFGFDRDFAQFLMFEPQETPASKPMQAASDWILKNKQDRFFVVVHARGGHFPWDATREQLKEMPPARYSGLIDPSQIGTLMLRMRKQRNPRLSEADRVRFTALYNHVVRSHDSALGDFITSLRNAGLEDDTLLLIASDSGATLEDPIPFLKESRSADATRLLLVARPGNQLQAAARVTLPVAAEDVASTVLTALGLALPSNMPNRSLTGAVDGSLQVGSRLRSIAYADSTTYLVGSSAIELRGGTARLCHLRSDPTCSLDQSASHPIAFFDALARARRLEQEPVLPGTSVTLDFNLGNALSSWGLLEGSKP
jgi:arylsulfatase A-like enzyme